MPYLPSLLPLPPLTSWAGELHSLGALLHQGAPHLIQRPAALKDMGLQHTHRGQEGQDSAGIRGGNEIRTVPRTCSSMTTIVAEEASTASSITCT